MEGLFVAYAESELLPISALQHLLYCERQAVLIHVERLWAENRYTAEGSIMHRRAHAGRAESRPEARTVRGLPVRSLELGLYGVADVVRWEGGDRVVPVEYKRGRPKSNDCDRVQLCAQALCLEEMRSISIPRGAIFYGKIRRRVPVELSAELRARTVEAAARLHELVRSGRTPAAEPGKKCEACSLRPLCMPGLSRRQDAARVFDHSLDRMIQMGP
jgi:CRISPR-associated exonuclease Cas4